MELPLGVTGNRVADIRVTYCRRKVVIKMHSSCGTLITFFVKAVLEKGEEMFNFTLLEKFFADQKT
jgi:hypothetical protein